MPIIPTLGVKGRQQSAAESGSELSLFEMNKMSLWCDVEGSSAIYESSPWLCNISQLLCQIPISWKFQ